MTIYQAICNAKEVWATMARVQRTDFQSLTGLEVCWRHGNYWRKDETPLVNVYRSIWQAMGVELAAFSDSTGVSSDLRFSAV